MSNVPPIPGYPYGDGILVRSRVTPRDFEPMQASVLFSDGDTKHPQISHEVVKAQVGAILDVWHGFVGSTHHRLASFTGTREGQPLARRLSAVRKRRAQWDLDTARGADIERMRAAWVKSCLLQMRFWTCPYVKDGNF